MKKILSLLFVILLISLVLCGCKAKTSNNPVSTTTKQIEQSLLEFIGEDRTITVGEEIILPVKYEKNGLAGNTSELNWSTSNPAVVTLDGNKAKGVSPGQSEITVSVGELSDKLTITVINDSEKVKTVEEVVADLMDDENNSTTYANNTSSIVYASEYEVIKTKRLPLEEGETYVETFDKDYVHSRLYPEIMVNGAVPTIKENIEGMTGKCLSITTDGDANGNYDSIVFKGFKITPGARYRITLTAKTMNDGRNYYVGFRGDAGDSYAFNFSGTGGELQTATGVITLTKTNYDGLVIMIAGGDAAELIIDNLTVERMIKLPEIDLTQVGSSVLFNFEDGMGYASANKSVLSLATGEEAITGTSLKVRKIGNWQGVDFTDMKFAAEGLYKVTFDIKLLSGSAGMAFATFSSAANGSYQDVGNQITVLNTSNKYRGIYKLKDFSDYFFNLSFSDSSCEFVIDNLKIECISEDDIVTLDLTSPGSKYTENFDGAASVEDLGFIIEASSILTLVQNETGYALQIKKTSSWAGLNTCNIILKSSGTYRVSFKMKLVSGSTDNMWATFTSAGNGSYQDVGQKVVPTNEWTEFSLTYTLKAYDDYLFTFSFYDASAVVLLDDLVIECVS